jgi:putative spermidine/putrescine transport system substrate-binding protein
MAMLFEEWKMMKALGQAMSIGTVAVIAVVSVGALQAVAAEKKLTIASWGGAFQEAEAKAFFEPFAKANGVTIVQDTWDGELSKIRAMVDTKNVTWDLVVADYGHAIAGCPEGILEKIDMTKFGDVSDFLPGTLHKCGISSDVYSLIFAYDASKLPEGPKTIADVFDVKKFPGKRGLRKQPKYLLEQALMADGVPPADVYRVLDTPEGVDRAFAKLNSIKSDVIWWSSNAQAAQLLANGEVVISEIYNGRFYDLIKSSDKHIVPMWDGQIYAPDTWIIPKGANKELAESFLAFMAQPKVLADFSSQFPYAPARTSAMPFVSKDITPYLTTYPANFKNALSSNEDWWADHDEALRERFEKWLAE